MVVDLRYHLASPKFPAPSVALSQVCVSHGPTTRSLRQPQCSAPYPNTHVHNPTRRVMLPYRVQDKGVGPPVQQLVQSCFEAGRSCNMERCLLLLQWRRLAGSPCLVPRNATRPTPAPGFLARSDGAETLAWRSCPGPAPSCLRSTPPPLAGCGHVLAAPNPRPSPGSTLFSLFNSCGARCTACRTLAISPSAQAHCSSVQPPMSRFENILPPAPPADSGSGRAGPAWGESHGQGQRAPRRIRAG